MYTYDEFKQELVKGIQDKVENDVKVTLVDIIKNNDTQRTAISLSKNGEKFTPSIHVVDLYERYESGEDIDEIIMDFLYVYENKENVELSEILEEWDKAKKYITVAAINREWNKNFLSYTVHKNQLDLSFVCKCVFLRNENIRASYNVTYELLNQWGITEEEFWITALENLEKEKFVIKELNVVLEMITGKKSVYNNVLYVITCPDMKDGAKVFLRTDCFKALADKLGSDLYVFPSSIDELLCASADKNLKIGEMKAMVKEINETQVPEDKRLSNEVYYYSREKDEISIV